MLEKKYKVRSECPFRVCGTISRPSPETSKRKFIGKNEEANIPCPLCGKKVKGEIKRLDFVDEHSVVISDKEPDSTQHSRCDENS